MNAAWFLALVTTVALAAEPPASESPPAQLPKLQRPIHQILGEQFEKIDPRKDGWDTEAFSEAASQQLERLGKLASHANELTPAELDGIVSSKYHSGALRPSQLTDVYRAGPLVIRRTASPSPEGATTAADHATMSGATGMIQALRSALAEYGDAKVRIKFKLFRVEREQGEQDKNEVRTSAYFQAFGETATGALQQNSLWVCRWTLPQGTDAPLLLGVTVESYEEALAEGDAGRRGLFTEQTTTVFWGEPVYAKQLSHGIDYWRSRLESAHGIDVSGFTGMAIGDANGDGLDDVYICQSGGLPNRLLLHQPDGSVRDVSAAAKCDYLDRTTAALFVDLDNDGDQDLVLSTDYNILFLENVGKPLFRLALKQSTDAMAYSLSAADFDQDGDLDIYVCHHAQAALPHAGGPTSPNPWYDANNGAPNHLYRNEGRFKFKDATVAVGLDQNNRRFSWASAWEDFDNDGDLDLYVANDFGRNNLYRNDKGHFVDIAAEAGVEDTSAGMSVSWGDPNRDGRMDIYVGNMFSSAGNRITYQRQFKEGLDTRHLSDFRRHARGNSLFENAGDGTFRDVSVEAAVTMGRWAWCSLFADINNDGYDDLLVSNGYVTQGPGDL